MTETPERLSAQEQIFDRMRLEVSICGPNVGQMITIRPLALEGQAQVHVTMPDGSIVTVGPLGPR